MSSANPVMITAETDHLKVEVAFWKAAQKRTYRIRTKEVAMTVIMVEIMGV